MRTFLIFLFAALSGCDISPRTELQQMIKERNYCDLYKKELAESGLKTPGPSGKKQIEECKAIGAWE